MKNTIKGLAIGCLLIGVPALTMAGETVPNSFSAGDVVSSSSINSNFSFLADRSFGLIGTDIYYTDGNVGIGTTSPVGKLEVSEEGSKAAILATTYWDSSAHSVFVTRRARGTAANPTTVQAGDVLGVFGGKGHDGNSFPTLANAALVFITAEAYSPTGKGTLLNFMTTPIGAVDQQTRMTISDSGNVGIGTTIPDEKLEVSGNVKATDFLATGAITGTGSSITITNSNGTSYTSIDIRKYITKISPTHYRVSLNGSAISPAFDPMDGVVHFGNLGFTLDTGGIIYGGG